MEPMEHIFIVLYSYQGSEYINVRAFKTEEHAKDFIEKQVVDECHKYTIEEMILED